MVHTKYIDRDKYNDAGNRLPFPKKCSGLFSKQEERTMISKYVYPCLSVPCLIQTMLQEIMQA